MSEFLIAVSAYNGPTDSIVSRALFRVDTETGVIRLLPRKPDLSMINCLAIPANVSKDGCCGYGVSLVPNPSPQKLKSVAFYAFLYRPRNTANKKLIIPNILPVTIKIILPPGYLVKDVPQMRDLLSDLMQKFQLRCTRNGQQIDFGREFTSVYEQIIVQSFSEIGSVALLDVPQARKHSLANTLTYERQPFAIESVSIRNVSSPQQIQDELTRRAAIDFYNFQLNPNQAVATLDAHNARFIATDYPGAPTVTAIDLMGSPDPVAFSSSAGEISARRYQGSREIYRKANDCNAPVDVPISPAAASQTIILSQPVPTP